MIEVLNSLDTALFLFLNNFHAPWADPIMVITSGRLTWIPLYLITLIYIFYKYRLRGFLLFSFIVLSIAIADRTSVELFKNVFERLRPSHNDSISNLIHLVNGYRGGSYGFVSSHAANTFAFAAITSLLFKTKWYSWVIFSWATFVSYSRIYLGVHYPGDILGGALLGVLSGFASYYLYGVVVQKWFNTPSVSIKE